VENISAIMNQREQGVALVQPLVVIEAVRLEYPAASRAEMIRKTPAHRI